MSTVKERKRMDFMDEGEPPPKKLISDADIFIKQLVDKQSNTVTTLKEQLGTTKEFTKAVELVPLANYNPGTSSLQQFQQTIKHFDDVETLQAAGLVKEHIQLLFDSLRGDEYLFQKHKNREKTLLKQQLVEIEKKVKEYEAAKSLKEQNKIEKSNSLEYGLSVKPDSIETKLLKFALNNKTEKEKPTLPHPINDIKKIENDRFGELHKPPLSSVDTNKIRRKARKLLNRLNKVNTTTNYDFNATSQTVNACKKNKYDSLVKESRWDVMEPSNEEIKTQYVEKKVYTCLPQNYYTIKNGEIVKLGKEEIKQKELRITPKLSIDEIKQLPKFHNYEIGTSSKILYLKNLSNTVKEDDLKHLFRNYDQENKLLYRIMKGKMRGQAFVTFPDENTATKALDDVNGIVLKNKPIVIEFGNARNANDA